MIGEVTSSSQYAETAVERRHERALIRHDNVERSEGCHYTRAMAHPHLRFLSSLWLSVLAVSVLSVVGCSTGDPDSSFGDAGKSGSHTGGTAGASNNTGGSTSGSNAGASAGTDVLGGTSGSTSGTSAAGTGGTGGQCAGDTNTAKRIPLDIYMMLDQSGSMTSEVDPGTTKWQAVVDAMTGFWNNTPPDGLSIGLQFFSVVKNNAPTSCTSTNDCNGAGPCDDPIHACIMPDSDNTLHSCTTDEDCNNNGGTCEVIGLCSGGVYACFPDEVFNTGCDFTEVCQSYSKVCVGRDSCDVADYATPLVAIASLDQNRSALVGQFDGRVPDTNTPTAPALKGAVQYAQGWANGSGQGHKVITILVTDGFPSVCSAAGVDPIQEVADVATAARIADPSMQKPGIDTYVIGVFAPDEAAGAQANLDKIALAGAGRDAFVISSNVTQELTDALNEIRGSALSCEYEIPTGENTDIQHVILQFTPNGGDPSEVHYVETPDHCDPATGGWYYDNDPNVMGNVAPTKILVCPSTCTTFTQASEGSVSIKVGCKNDDIQIQ